MMLGVRAHVSTRSLCPRASSVEIARRKASARPAARRPSSTKDLALFIPGDPAYQGQVSFDQVSTGGLGVCREMVITGQPSQSLPAAANVTPILLLYPSPQPASVTPVLR